MNTETDAVRLDKWLWAARFFKTRKLAGEAIAGGKVHVNQQRAKPGKEIKPGAHLSITKDHLHWKITVVALTTQRRPAKEAALLYEEDPASRALRQQQLIEERELRKLFPFNGPDRKPNKKDRRLIHRFKQG
ncbi:MAG: RNA-binding S4 domain-containing protein [Gammaproteobacteria bacterium]